MTVVVVVGGCRAERVTAADETRVDGDVREGSVVIVAKQPIADWRAARVARQHAALAEKDVEPAVAVVIKERGAAAPLFDVVEAAAGAADMRERQTRGGRHVGELHSARR